MFKRTKLLIAAHLLLVASVASAESLSVYRGDAKTVASRKNEVEALSRKLLKLLGQDTFSLAPLPTGKPENKGENRYRRMSSSQIVKINLDALVKELIRQERYDKPMTFTPSSTQYTWEAEEALRQFRIKACRKVLAKQSPTAMKDALGEFHSLSLKPPSSQSREQANATDELVTLLRSGRADKTGTTLEKAFGPIAGTEILENSIYSIRFRGGSDTTAITLSMVLTALADEDDTFVTVLDCLTDEVKIQLGAANKREKEFAELSSNKNRLKSIAYSDITKRRDALQKQINLAGIYTAAYYQGLFDFVNPKLENARRFNATFKTLSQSSKAALLAALIRAQQNEIATSSEQEVLSTKIGKVSQTLYTEYQKASGAEKEIKVERLARISADGAYFRQIPTQMSRLYDRLVEKKQIEAQTRKLIRNEIEVKP